MTEYNSNLKYIFTHYGKKTQETKLIEELSELIRAIARNDTENFIEELADVQVLIDQFTLLYPDLAVKVVEIKHKKAARQIKRIKGDL